MFKLPNKFMSEDVYKNFSDKQNFLYQLEQVFDWEGIAKPLWDLAKNEQGGRPRHSPVVMLKMIFLQFLYDRSDREMEEMATYDLRVKQFLHLAIDEHSPDYSCLSRFRDELLREKGQGFLDEMFEQILNEAKRHGIVFGKVYAIDATHVLSSINGKKDSHGIKAYDTASKDPDASWGTKGLESKIDKNGKKVMVRKHFFGYKLHGICETKHGLTTNLSVTTGKTSDLDAGDRLIHHKLTKQQRNAIDVLLADKGYGCCPIFINLLEKYDGIMTAFCLPRTMTERGEHQNKWQNYMKDEGRTAFRKLRAIIERIFGDTKRNHGLERARYRGQGKTYLQASLSMAAHNVKFIVKQITGTRFKPI